MLGGIRLKKLSRATIIKIYNSIIGEESSYKVQNERLNKICNLFSSEELESNLLGIEKDMYIKYIIPVITKVKNIEEISVIFFAALLANYNKGEYQISTLNNKDRETTDSEDWFCNIQENVDIAIEKLKEIQFINNQYVKDSELKEAYKIKDPLILSRNVKQIQEKYISKDEWEKKWLEDRKLYYTELINIISVFSRIDLIYFESQLNKGNACTVKLENILRELECLPIDIKRKFLANNEKYIDILHNEINITVENIYKNVELAKVKKNNEEIINASTIRMEYEMLKIPLENKINEKIENMYKNIGIKKSKT